MLKYALRVTLWAAFIVLVTLLLWRPAFRLLFPIPYAEIVEEAAAEHGIDSLLVVAIMRTESHFDTGAVSPRGARGLMQLMPETARWAAEQMPLPGYRPELIDEPKVNITVASWYIRFLLDLFEQRTVVAVAAYNAGPGTVQGWLDKSVWQGTLSTAEQIPFAETRAYVRKVAEAYRMYRLIHAGSHPGYIDLIQ